MENKNHLLKSTVIRLASDGAWWLMNNPEKGWSSFGFRYSSLFEVLEHWNVQIGALGADEFGTFISVVLAP